jgi:hypothetical protein
MDFEECIKMIEQKLKEKDPKEFGSTWIEQNVPAAYRYICKNVRSEIGLDWDRVTMALSRKYQRRWIRYRRKPIKQYENQAELDKILERYRDKLYIFIAVSNDKEEDLKHRIAVSLVRAAQKGNVLAMRELTSLLRYMVDEWIDRYFCFRRWHGAESEIDTAIEGCIRRYRYTGTFFGYLFKTMEYSANGLRPLYSLDGYMNGTERRFSEVVGQDPESGDIRVYG